MRLASIILITFVLGVVAGGLYGWRSGYTDGEVSRYHSALSFVKGYGALRGTLDAKGRDRMVDFMLFDAGHSFAHGHAYSPLFQVMHSKADEGLLSLEAYWELNYEQESIWPNGAYPPLFDQGSPEAIYAAALKKKNPKVYQKILKEQRELREKLTIQKESDHKPR